MSSNMPQDQQTSREQREEGRQSAQSPDRGDQKSSQGMTKPDQQGNSQGSTNMDPSRPRTTTPSDDDNRGKQAGGQPPQGGSDRR